MAATDEVDAYLAEAPEARREALTRLRELCLAELTGFEEVMAYGMPAYVRAGAEAGEIAWANQKQYISFYLLRTDIRDAFADRLAGHDMGKACLRFRRPRRWTSPCSATSSAPRRQHNRARPAPDQRADRPRACLPHRWDAQTHGSPLSEAADRWPPWGETEAGHARDGATDRRRLAGAHRLR